ncbi:phosphoribosylanthranilate isomerase [Galbibacter sp. BG1]
MDKSDSNNTLKPKHPHRSVEIGLKICGMKYEDNIRTIAGLQPDYLGFIFYEKSARFNEDVIPELPKNIKKIGVFVNATIDYIIEKVNQHHLNGVQLHGDESVEFCQNLKKELPHKTIIIKVFSIKDEFDFSILSPYEKIADYYLFDTKGKLPGGNGYTFNWEVLKNYPSEKPFFLSGGIGTEHIEKIKHINPNLPIHAIDVNSKFEVEPGLKNAAQLKDFISRYKNVSRE